MGAFGALGAAAGGFEQAHQQDLQRQFIDEQARRQSALDIFKTLALDPNQPPEVRNLGMQQYGVVINTPYGKFNQQKVFGPVQDAMADFAKRKMLGQQFQQQNQGPPVMQGGGQLNLPAMTHTFNYQPQLPPGTAGPPPPPQSFQSQVPAMQAAGPKPQITPGAIPPLPPELADTARSGYFAGIPEMVQNTAALAGAPILGQAGAREQVLNQIPGFNQESPLVQGVMTLGGNPAFLSRGFVAGQSVSGESLLSDPTTRDVALSQGVQPDKFYNSKKTPAGWQFAETAGRGQVAGENGQLLSQANAAGARTTATQQAQMPFWQKKNQIQFGQRQALLNQQFELGVQRGIYGDANKAFVDSVKDYGSALKTMRSMDEAYQAVQQNPNNQQAQVALLMAHIGMTLGVVKGARVGKAQIEEAEQSRTMFAGAASKLNFDKNGDLDWTDPIRKGVTLTPEQMKQMVELGHQRMGILHQNIGDMHNALDPNTMETPYIAPTPMGGGAKKPRGGGPPKQGEGGGGKTINYIIKNGELVPAPQPKNH